jgi:hypothetical protein
VPRGVRGWRLVLTAEGWVLVRGSETIRDIERIRDVVATCPRCGRRASSFYVTRNGYVYAWHSIGHGKKHQWCVGPESEFTLSLLTSVRKRLSPEEKDLVTRVFLKGEEVGDEERAKARKALARLLGLE